MSDQATFQRSRASKRRRRILVRRAVALTGLVLIGLVGVGLALAGSPGVLPSGTTVAGVDVAGMSEADALRTLESRSRALLRRPVTFAAGDAEMSLSGSQLGVRADWRQAVAAAAAAGDGFGPLRGFRRLKLRIDGGDVRPPLAWYGSAVDYAVDSLARKVGRRPVPARIERRPGGGFAIVAGRSGVALDQERAREAVVAALASLERPERVTLVVSARPAPVTPAGLRRALADARTGVSAPLRLTHGKTTITVPARTISGLLELPRGGATRTKIGGRAAERWFDQLKRRLGRSPVDAGWEVTDGGAVRVTPSLPGVRVDIPATVERFQRAAFSRGRRTAEVAVRIDPPERTTEEARGLGIRELVSSYTTTYGGAPGRLHNVQLVSELVDGALVAPGATFSFNGVTGERNASRGFQEAPVIINGELQNGIGGGVCQVSTTVFNAAFEAGLPITGRTNHALYIGHYPLGRDATVNFPDVDLQFVNDTAGWMLVRTRVGAGALTVQLLGRSPGRRVETETAPLQVIGKTPFEVIRDETLPRRTRIVERIGTHPRATSVRRKVYDADGALISDRVWYSTYVGEPTVVRIGTKEPDPVREQPPLEAAVVREAVATPETGRAAAATPTSDADTTPFTPTVPAPVGAPTPRP